VVSDNEELVTRHRTRLEGRGAPTLEGRLFYLAIDIDSPIAALHRVSWSPDNSLDVRAADSAPSPHLLRRTKHDDLSAVRISESVRETGYDEPIGGIGETACDRTSAVESRFHRRRGHVVSADHPCSSRDHQSKRDGQSSRDSQKPRAQTPRRSLTRRRFARPLRVFRAAGQPDGSAETTTWRRGRVAEERGVGDEESGSKRDHENAPRQDLLPCEMCLDIGRYLSDHVRRRSSFLEERLGRELRYSLRCQNLNWVTIDLLAKRRVLAVSRCQSSKPIALTFRCIGQRAKACFAKRRDWIPMDCRLECLVVPEPRMKLVHCRFCLVNRSRHAATRFLTPVRPRLWSDWLYGSRRVANQESS
jgi:hypothetical protein